ncbi:MAG: hypothetical protein JXB47_01710 [Anaerolineae bacterium]|nr:hypothetical protein [Anaerolineae bacterium]
MKLVFESKHLRIRRLVSPQAIRKAIAALRQPDFPNEKSWVMSSGIAALKLPYNETQAVQLEEDVVH